MTTPPIDEHAGAFRASWYALACLNTLMADATCEVLGVSQHGALLVVRDGEPTMIPHIDGARLDEVSQHKWRALQGAEGAFTRWAREVGLH